MIKFIYDLCIFLTTNYSKMPDDFKSRFPEESLVNLRQVAYELFTSDETDFSDYE